MAIVQTNKRLLRENARAIFLFSIALMACCINMPAQSARPASPSQVSVPLSDARDVGAKSVRFSAAQFTRESVTVILFGATEASWAKLRAAVQQAVFDGYPVKMVFIGPVSEPRAIEVYAKGHHVTRRIDPETISAMELAKLLRDVTREYYRR